MHKIIELSGVVGYEITAKGLKNRLPKDQSEVLLKVDSVGGSVFEGIRVFNTLRDYKGLIKIELGAIAASMASYFPLAVGVENIKVRKNTTYMIHKSWGITVGNADEMKADSEILAGLDIIMAKEYSKATGMELPATLEEMKNELWLIGGENVVAAGFASGIVEDSELEEPAGVEPEPQDIVEKAEIQARMQEAQKELRAMEAQEDLGQWAAVISETLNPSPVQETDEGQALLFSESASTDRGENIKEEEFKMKLNEFLSKNPEAKAEYTEALAQGTQEAVAADRERFSKVLALSGISIPEAVLTAAKAGQTVEQFAVAELETRNTLVVAAKKEPGNEIGALATTEQTPAKPKATVEEAKDKQAEEDVQAYLKGGKK